MRFHLMICLPRLMRNRIAIFIFCFSQIGCADDPLERETCFPLEDDVSDMANILPLSEGEQWDFDYSYRKGVVDVVHHVTTREGTVTLNVLEISPCDQDQRFISLEKSALFLEVEMWDSLADGVDVRYDSTSLVAIDTIKWSVSGDGINMHDQPFPGRISRFAPADRDTVHFENMFSFDTGHTVTLVRDRGIVRYTFGDFIKSGYDLLEIWTRRDHALTP